MSSELIGSLEDANPSSVREQEAPPVFVRRSVHKYTVEQFLARYGLWSRWEKRAAFIHFLIVLACSPILAFTRVLELGFEFGEDEVRRHIIDKDMFQRCAVIGVVIAMAFDWCAGRALWLQGILFLHGGALVTLYFQTDSYILTTLVVGFAYVTAIIIYIQAITCAAESVSHDLRVFMMCFIYTAFDIALLTMTSVVAERDWDIATYLAFSSILSFIVGSTLFLVYRDTDVFLLSRFRTAELCIRLERREEEYERMMNPQPKGQKPSNAVVRRPSRKSLKPRKKESSAKRQNSLKMTKSEMEILTKSSRNATQSKKKVATGPKIRPSRERAEKIVENLALRENEFVGFFGFLKIFFTTAAFPIALINLFSLVIYTQAKYSFFFQMVMYMQMDPSLTFTLYTMSNSVGSVIAVILGRGDRALKSSRVLLILAIALLIMANMPLYNDRCIDKRSMLRNPVVHSKGVTIVFFAYSTVLILCSALAHAGWFLTAVYLTEAVPVNSRMLAVAIAYFTRNPWSDSAYDPRVNFVLAALCGICSALQWFVYTRPSELLVHRVDIAPENFIIGDSAKSLRAPSQAPSDVDK